jgi:hypothetical protein
MSAWTGRLLPNHGIVNLHTTSWVSKVRCQGEGVPVHLKESNLIGTRPDFIPGNIDVMDDLAGLYGVRARIREHRIVERHSLIVRRRGAGRRYPITRGSNYLHAPIV